MTLEEAKLYLKIDDYYEDDLYIQTLIETTQIYIDSCVGEVYKNDVKLVKLATLVQYKLISELYDNRSFIDNVKSDKIVETIFMKLSNAGDIV